MNDRTTKACLLAVAVSLLSTFWGSELLLVGQQSVPVIPYEVREPLELPANLYFGEVAGNCLDWPRALEPKRRARHHGPGHRGQRHGLQAEVGVKENMGRRRRPRRRQSE